MAGAGGKQRRRGNPAKKKCYAKQRIKKPYERDIDQIVLHDMLTENVQKLKNQPVDEDKPGLGQNYCVPCARHFTTRDALETHLKSKQHKKRFKVVTTEKPYTHEEANRVAGLWNPKFKNEDVNM